MAQSSENHLPLLALHLSTPLIGFVTSNSSKGDTGTVPGTAQPPGSSQQHHSRIFNGNRVPKGTRGGQHEKGTDSPPSLQVPMPPHCPHHSHSHPQEVFLEAFPASPLSAFSLSCSASSEGACPPPASAPCDSQHTSGMAGGHSSPSSGLRDRDTSHIPLSLSPQKLLWSS